MRRGMSRVAALAAILLTPAAAFAGVVIQFENADGGISTMTSEGKKVRVETPARHHVMIFDGAAQKAIEIDPEKRSYREFTQEDAKMLAAMREQMLAKLPPEKRAEVESRIAKAREEAITYEPTGKRDTVAGYACQGYRMLRAGKSEEEACLIPWSSSPVKKDDIQGLVEFGKWVQSFTASVGGGGAAVRNPVVERLLSAPGFPALVEHVEADGKRARQDRLVSVKRTSAPGDAFTVPAGYTREQRNFGAAARGKRPE